MSARAVFCSLSVAFRLRLRFGCATLLAMEAAFSHPQSPLFTGSTAEEVREALLGLTPDLIAELRDDLADALEGSEDGVRRYVCSYRLLTDTLLGEAHRTLPNTTIETGEGRLVLAGRPARALYGVIENASVEAPFTPWANTYDAAEAVALFVTNQVRSLVGARMLMPPAEPLRTCVDDLSAYRFQQRVRRQLNRDDEGPLERLMRVFALSKSELGRLFAVSRQAIDGWLERGVPSDRQDKVATLLALADVLERKLKADRIPGIARRAADAYGGQTMLDFIAADRHRELLGLVRTSFDWSQPA